MDNITNLHTLDFTASIPNNKGQSYTIEIMPSFINADGSPNEAFETFYNTLCEAIPARDTKAMYALCDKCLPYESFEELLDNTLWEGLEQWSRFPNYKKGMSIAIDVSDMDMRFKSLLARFHIVTYILNVESANFSSPPKTKLDTYISDLYYTFKDGKYTLITKFDKFKISQNA